MTQVNVQKTINQVLAFIDRCRLDQKGWNFSSTPGGQETLYASCFACMLYHYLGRLDILTPEDKQSWAAFLNSWQDPKTGYYVGPEIVPEELSSRKHSYEHILQHLTAHVLPALQILGSKPVHPLSNVFPFTDQEYLRNWLNARDWRDAWLEGNNLLFIGQFLIHLRDVEKDSTAQSALDLYFNWLDEKIDPSTGLWGTNGFCSSAIALYGGYHQLLLYYFENHAVHYPERLIEVALSLQHVDGGFHPRGGGGACEDTDAVDILVNMYKRSNYKRPQIRVALRKALGHILLMQMPDGGFVYRRDAPFIHMGIHRTATPSNQSNLFSTWFRVHTLSLISEIITDEPFANIHWKFNPSCSMGWHQPWNKSIHAIGWIDRQKENWFSITQRTGRKLLGFAR